MVDQFQKRKTSNMTEKDCESYEPIEGAGVPRLICNARCSTATSSPLATWHASPLGVSAIHCSIFFSPDGSPIAKPFR